MHWGIFASRAEEPSDATWVSILGSYSEKRLPGLLLLLSSSVLLRQLLYLSELPLLYLQ